MWFLVRIYTRLLTFALDYMSKLSMRLIGGGHIFDPPTTLRQRALDRLLVWTEAQYRQSPVYLQATVACKERAIRDLAHRNMLMRHELRDNSYFICEVARDIQLHLDNTYDPEDVPILLSPYEIGMMEWMFVARQDFSWEARFDGRAHRIASLWGADEYTDEQVGYNHAAELETRYMPVMAVSGQD